MENNDINTPPIESQQSNEVSEDSKNQKICDVLEIVAYSISTIMFLDLLVAEAAPLFFDTFNSEWYDIATQWVMPIMLLVCIIMIVVSAVITRKRKIVGCKAIKIIVLPSLVLYFVSIILYLIILSGMRIFYHH